MNDLPAESEALWRQLQEVLLGHLSAAVIPAWPGSDSLTLEEVLFAYPPAAAAGRVPGYEQLLAERPDLERQLIAFFTAARMRRQ